jgi:nitrite reductase/ring-hydroxylating ferredoxin subunit
VTSEGISRRQTMTAAAALGAGVPLLAACGNSSGGGSGSGGSGSGGSGGGSAPSAGKTLGPSADVPVGGGKIYADEQVVVTQPSQGDFQGFSAICTHQGCLLSTVAEGTINCNCHGSRFSIKDGSVAVGPATTPLPEVNVSVKGGKVITG